jgi:hypothetical protein
MRGIKKCRIKRYLTLQVEFATFFPKMGRKKWAIQHRKLSKVGQIRHYFGQNCKVKDFRLPS